MDGTGVNREDWKGKGEAGHGGERAGADKGRGGLGLGWACKGQLWVWGWGPARRRPGAAERWEGCVTKAVPRVFLHVLWRHLSAKSQHVISVRPERSRDAGLPCPCPQVSLPGMAAGTGTAQALRYAMRPSRRVRPTQTSEAQPWRSPTSVITPSCAFHVAHGS